MLRIRVWVGVLAFAVLGGGLLLGDDPPKKTTDPKTDPAPVVRHQLPSGWKALGLSDDQKKKVFAIEDEYDSKITALKKKIEDLSKEERTKKYEVLTEDQKKRLKEIREAKDGGGTKDDKKDDKKKDDK